MFSNLSMTKKRKNSKVIVSVVMTLLMVFAAMPGLAFAAVQPVPDAIPAAAADTETPQPGYCIAITTDTSEITTATLPFNMEAAYKTPEDNDKDVHIEWFSSDKKVATIGQNKGRLSVQSAGEVTITAQLRKGASSGGDGTGGGTGDGRPPAGEFLAETCVTITIAQAEYGFQGRDGNSLMMLDPSDVETVSVSETGTDENGNPLVTYNNKFKSPVEAESTTTDENKVYQTISFIYTMSAGMNKFNETIFNSYKEEIGIYDKNGENRLADVELDDYDSENIMITANVTVSKGEAFVNGGTYILRFGPKVCGNNTSRKLGCNIDFKFTLAKSK